MSDFARGNRGRAVRWVAAAALVGVALGACGCGGDARVELAAAEALDRVAGQLDAALGEYTAEVAAADRSREADAISAFVVRVQGAADEEEVARHMTEFNEALARLRADQWTEWQRYQASRENVAAVREVADGLRRVAIATLTVQDDVRRYLTSLIEARRAAEAAQQRQSGSGP